MGAYNAAESGEDIRQCTALEVWKSTEYVSDWQYRSGAIIKNISTHGSGTQTQMQTHEPGWQRRWSKKKKKRNRR